MGFMGCSCKNAKTPMTEVYMMNPGASVDPEAALVESLRYTSVQASVAVDSARRSGKVLIYRGPSNSAAKLIQSLATRGIRCQVMTK